METYLLVNIFFLALVMLVFGIRRVNKPMIITLGVLLILTAVFDSLIVGLDIVAYDPAKILGIYIGVAPIEDFFYAILSALLIPTVWHILGKYYAPKS